jgi:hypothetical protein
MLSGTEVSVFSYNPSAGKVLCYKTTHVYLVDDVLVQGILFARIH